MRKKRTLPFGYTIRNGLIEIDQREADVICEIFEDYISGASMKDLASKLTRERIPYTEKRVEWNKNVIARILQNQKYTGEGDYAPIIDKVFFKQANAQKQERATKAPKINNGLLSIILPKVICGKCGEQMFRTTDRRNCDYPHWKCVNPNCRTSVIIKDDILFLRIQERLNLVIDNTDMLVSAEPYQEHEEYYSGAAIESLEHLCSTGNYDDQYLIQIIMGNAADVYNHYSNSRLINIANVNAAFADAAPTPDFNADLFIRTVKAVSLHANGNLSLILKSDVEI